MRNAKFENNKGRIARITIIIVAIAIMTTSFAMGTFAKYATGDNTSSSARVAKWGVTVDIVGESDMFVSNYDNTVIAADSKDVVAPGTKNDTGVTFEIKGTPEVRTQINISITDADGNAPKEVFLKYNDGGVEKTYYPVKFTLKQVSSASGNLPDSDGNADNGYDGILVNGGTLADVKAVLDAYSGTEYAPNTNLGAKFQLTWEWVYERGTGAEITANDLLDTKLGDLAAGIITADPASYNLTIDYKISISIIQVD